jgi:hypothetical protein
MNGDDDGSAFSSAKLGDFVRGEVKENDDLYPHTGITDPGSDASELLSFLEGLDVDSDSAASTLVRKSAATDRVGGSVGDIGSFAVGLTETDVDISEAQAYGKIANSILNDNAPYVAVMFGSMNYGKTSFAFLMLELWKELVEVKYGRDDPLILTNMSGLDAADHTIQSLERFRELVFGDEEYLASGGNRGVPPELDPDRPKWWHFDECSTHLDARTKGWEVPNLYLPLVKRFAKVNLDAIHLGHSGMDIHADMRRSHITTEFIFKTSKKVANVYSSMNEDAGGDLKYVLEEVPDTSIAYDPDDYSPFSWETV